MTPQAMIGCDRQHEYRRAPALLSGPMGGSRKDIGHLHLWRSSGSHVNWHVIGAEICGLPSDPCEVAYKQAHLIKISPSGPGELLEFSSDAATAICQLKRVW